MEKILIDDDHAVIRMAVRLLLEKAGHEIVGEAGSGVDVVARARKLLPGFIILDIDLPKIDGLGVLEHLCGNGSHFRVLIFSSLQSKRYAIRCSRAGAAGFVCKESNLSDLLPAVKIVLGVYTLFPTTKFSSVSYTSRQITEEEAVKTLSSRDLAVLRYLARGYRVTDIARELFLRVKAVSTYKNRLITKLHVANLIELVEITKRNELA